MATDCTDYHGLEMYERTVTRFIQKEGFGFMSSPSTRNPCQSVKSVAKKFIPSFGVTTPLLATDYTSRGRVGHGLHGLSRIERWNMEQKT